MVALSVSACRDLGMFSVLGLVWGGDTKLFRSCRACWSSVAKLMSFWKQLIKGAVGHHSHGRHWLSITKSGVAQHPAPGPVDKWIISAVVVSAF